MNQSCLAGAIWTEQSDCFAAKIAAQTFKDRSATERDTESEQINHCGIIQRLRVCQFLLKRCGKCHALLIALRPDNSKRIPNQRQCPLVEKRQCRRTLLMALKFYQLQESRSETQA